MVYQISERNQILIALFGIVVLCAGKLFKDYLNRGGYIEGMTVNYETTPRSLKRPASGTGPTTNNTIFLNVTLSATLPANTDLNVSWSTVAAAAAQANIILPTTSAGYTATNIVSSGTDISLTTGAVTTTTSGSTNVPSAVSFTHTSAINSGEWIRITIKDISISATPATAFDLVFTVTPGSGTSITTTVNIGTASAPASGGASDGQDARTANDIRNTIALIDAEIAARVSTNTPSDQNVISTLRQSKSALLNMLASTYGTVKEAGQVFDSKALYDAQRTAMDFIQNEKARSAKNAKMLTEDNHNKRRMAQVNTYYTRHYEENTEVMKNIIYVTVALIILAILRNKELIPASISTLGIILVITFGGIVIGAQVFDIIRRNDHDFDKYDWNFNEDEMNRKQLLQQNADPANLSEMGMGMAQCYGPGCCDVGTTWDNNLNKCVPSTSRVTGTAVWAPTSQVTSAGTLTVTITPSTALPSNGTVTLTLPTGLFTGTPTVSGLTTTTATATSIVFSGVTVAAGVASSPIVITGLSKSSGDGVSSISRTLTVKTSVDTNETSIKITGI
jgi:hypothetical protein